MSVDPSPAGDPHVQDVAVRGFTWAAAAGWATFVTISGTIAAVFRSVGLPRIVELLFNRNKELRAEQRQEEEADNTARLAAETRARAAEQRAIAAESRQVYLASAVSLLIGVVEQLDPNNPGLKQARELIAMAANSDDAFSTALKRLAVVPGVGE